MSYILEDYVSLENVSKMGVQEIMRIFHERIAARVDMFTERQDAECEVFWARAQWDGTRREDAEWGLKYDIAVATLELKKLQLVKYEIETRQHLEMLRQRYLNQSHYHARALPA